MSRSPYYDAGAADGKADSDALSQCPPGVAAGQNPSKAWSVMYRRGYDGAFHPTPCDHRGDCKKAKRLAKRREAGQPMRRPPLAFKQGSLAHKPGRLAFKQGSLAYNPNRGALAAKMKARAERIEQGNGEE